MDAHSIADFRRAVRAHLAERPAVAQSADTIHRHLGREHAASRDHVAAACAFLVDLGHLRHVPDSLGGAAAYFKATAAGIIAHERGD